MPDIPQEIINHCERYQACKGCPLGTCVAPVSSYPGEAWDKWLESRIEAVMELYK